MDQPPHVDVEDLPTAPLTLLPNHASDPPAHVSSPARYSHDVAYEPHFIPIWTTQRLRRLKTSCKEIAHSLIGRFRGLYRQERNSKDKAELSIVPRNTFIYIPSADYDAFQSDAIRHSTTHSDAILSNTSGYQVVLSRTCDVPIYITPHSAQSDIARIATCTYDSACELNLMSSSYAANTLGIHFDNPVQEPIARTICGEILYSIGVVKARWFPMQGATLSSPSGDTITLAFKTHWTTFHVIDTDGWDVYIGHPTLLENGCLKVEARLPLVNPVRHYVSPNGPAPVTTPEQDQDYLRRMKEERKREEAARQRRAAAQQTQGT